MKVQGPRLPKTGGLEKGANQVPKEGNSNMVPESHGTVELLADVDKAISWLEQLHGDSTGYIHLCSAGNWSGQVCADSSQAAGYIRMMDHRQAQGIYARATTINVPHLERGTRGGVEHTDSVSALWADVDFAGPGHKSDKPLPPGEDEARQLVVESGLPEPTIWIHSGGGLYPYWLLAEPIRYSEHPEVAELSRRWHEILAKSAERLGWHYGTETSDLARVLRLPGTINRKVPGSPRMVTITEGGTGQLFSYEGLQECARQAVESRVVADGVTWQGQPSLSEPLPPIPQPAPMPAVDSGLSPGDTFEQQASWEEILTRHGWTLFKDHGSNYKEWTRPGKATREGSSATTGQNPDRDRLYVFSSSTPFEPMTPYNKFAAYAVLNHGGDHSAAAAELRQMGYGGSLPERTGPPDEFQGGKELAVPPSREVSPIELSAALEVYGSWLHIEDEAPVLVVAATVAAHLAEGDPLWTLIVGPPSSGKTEVLNGIGDLPYVHGVATLTEAALMSGVPKKEYEKGAKGGLMREIGESGIILCKDFTSILSRNKDRSAEALAALREIYDGEWTRRSGASGGIIGKWSGKCGLIGGVTPSIDRYRQVVGSLGDRYLMLRLPPTNDEKMAHMALAQGNRQREMRNELSEAMLGLIAGVDLSFFKRDLSEEEVNRLSKLSIYAAHARTAVERNGYGDREIEVWPQAEGPSRIAGQLRRLMHGLEAVGVDDERKWSIVTRVAMDCVPATRTPVIRVLAESSGQWETRALSGELHLDFKTIKRQVEDLRALDIVNLVNPTGNQVWKASPWLRKFYPGDAAEDGTSEAVTSPTPQGNWAIGGPEPFEWGN